jgi:hypothetical protein
MTPAPTAPAPLVLLAVLDPAAGARVVRRQGRGSPARPEDGGA